jgi:hypothetical protein
MLVPSQVGDGQAVDHAKSSGRIAFACTSVPPIFERVKAQGDVIQTPPLTLPTPGKVRPLPSHPHPTTPFHKSESASSLTSSPFTLFPPPRRTWW